MTDKTMNINIKTLEQLLDSQIELLKKIAELKQELKKLSGEALSTGKSQKRGSKLKEVD